MTTLLRRSGNLLRQSRTRPEGFISHAIRPFRLLRAQPLGLVAHSARSYATTKPEKPEGQESNGKHGGNDGVKKRVDQKPFTSSSPLPIPKHNGDQLGQSGATAANNVPLTEEEIKTLDALLEFIKKDLPKGQREDIARAFEQLRKQGLPADIKKIMQGLKEGKRLDLASAARLARLSTTLARQAAKERMAAEAESDRDATSRTQKSRPQNSNDTFNKQSGQSNRKPPKSTMPELKEFRVDFGSVFMVLFSLYLLYRLIIPGESSKEITWQEFRTNFFDKGLVSKLTVINEKRVRVELHREAAAQIYPDLPVSNPFFHYYFSIGSVDAFERRLDDAQTELKIPSSQRIPVQYTDEMPWFATFLNFGPTLLFIAAIVWLSRQAGRGAGGQSGLFGIGKSRARKYNHETDVKITFADVAGCDEAKVEIMEFVSFLKRPERYQKLGAKIPRGAILSGPPGTGKTLLAKATAGESGVPFFSVSGSEFVEMFVGVGPSRVRDLFANARKHTPCIIFIDEIDAIGKSRGRHQLSGGGNDERESTLNQILTEMDGFNTSDQVVVLAGTNRPDVLDKALLRPGRFDRHITIDRPTMEGRRQIFAVHLKKIVTKEDMKYLQGRLAALTPGFSGADIANCVNEAALIAARETADTVTMHHFEVAIERVIGGLERKSLVISPEEKRTIAYHEAGHAICGWYFRYADPLLKVSIIPRGQGALGYAQYLPQGESYLMNTRQLMDRMAMTLGGRVSEEIHFDTVTTGASDDFDKVTRMAAAMVTKWGMSKKIGTLFFQDDNERLHKPFSEETARNIDSEVRRIVDEAYKQCKELLLEKKKQIGMVAEELLAKEMLSRDDLVRLLGPRPWSDNEEFAKYFGEGKQGTIVAPPPPPSEQNNTSGSGDAPSGA